MIVKAKVTQDGLMAIPAALRKRLGVKNGGSVTLDDSGAAITLSSSAGGLQENLKRNQPEAASHADKIGEKKQQSAGDQARGTLSMITTRITAGGRIVIPAEIRKRLGLEIGETVGLEIDRDDTLRISSRSRSLREAQELFRKHIPTGLSVVDDFIADRRKEAENE